MQGGVGATMLSSKSVVRAAMAGCALYLCMPAASAQSATTSFNIPTDAPRSPLFGAEPFTQKMLMFEEFGTRTMPKVEKATGLLMQGPTDCASSPGKAKLDNIINHTLWP